jgi:hypothetical protein
MLRNRVVTTGLISALLASGSALMFAYHSAILLAQPDEYCGYVYAFLTKGGYRFTTGLTLNQLLVSILIFLTISALFFFATARSKTFPHAAAEITFNRKILFSAVLLYVIFVLSLYYFGLAAATALAANSIYLRF